MGANVWYFCIEFFESNSHFDGYFFCDFDVRMSFQEQCHHQVLYMREVDEIVLIVKIDCSQFRISLCLNSHNHTFCKLL